jgi:hypothetical protein
MLIVTIVYCVLNFVVQSIIQPRFIGDAVELSVTVTFLALVFWARLLGPVGAILAIPPTLLVKALLVEVDPRARWADALLRARRRLRNRGAADLAARLRPLRRGGRSEVGSVDAVAEEAPIMGREHGEPATAHTELCVYRPHVALHGVDRHRQVDGDLVER